RDGLEDLARNVIALRSLQGLRDLRLARDRVAVELRQSVRIGKDQRTGFDRDDDRRRAVALTQAERKISVRKFDNAAVRDTQQRWGMTGVRERQLADDRIEDADERGDEAIVSH